MAESHPNSAAESASPSLSLPASHFAKLAPASFLAAHLPKYRPSGRTPQQARGPTLNANSLTHTHGSAVVRIGDTAVVCGVRAEVVEAQGVNHGQAESDARHELDDARRISDLGLLIPNIELATGCSPLYLPGNPPTALAQSLTHRILTMLRISNILRLHDLQIWAAAINEPNTAGDEPMKEYDEDDGSSHELNDPQIMAFWALYIDVLVISLDGSPFDAAWAAVLAALRNTRLPASWWDRDMETVLCDPRDKQIHRLSLRGCPMALSFAVFHPPLRVGSKRTDQDILYVLADPDDFEESCCAQSITLVVDDKGAKILRIEIGGGPMLDPSDLGKLVKRAGQRWEEWNAILVNI